MSDDQAPVARVQLVTLWLLALFLLAGVFTRKPENVLASVAGIAIAMPAAALAVTQRSRPRLAVTLNLVAGVGVVLVAGGSHASLACFGLCILALTSMLTSGPRPGHVFACAALIYLFARLAQAGFSTDWLPWIGGVFISALGG
ncbi:MAG: hypothetical protein KGL15_00675, partial [Acidobacteriota bacterium]|nr:hypothetical protein [Acidobacteriota bacterium]